MSISKLKLFFVFFLLRFSSFYAQYTDVINSNKPGFSESPYSVGKGIYQIETNLFFRNTAIESTFTRPQSFGLDLVFRTSFFSEKLELNTQVRYQEDKVAFKNIFTSHYFTSGFSKITLNAKYLLFSPKYKDPAQEIRSWRKKNAFDINRLLPSVALYIGMNTNFVNEIHQKGNISPKAGILLQNNLTNDFNIITNFYYDFIGTRFVEYAYIVTATQNFSGRWSAFLENQMVFQKHQNNINMGAGLAYLLHRNLQLNASSRLFLEGNLKGIYLGFGASYRIDNHNDGYTKLYDNGEKIKDTPISKYNKKQNSFFTKIFSIFKKKNKRKKIKRKKTETDIEKLEREIKELEKEIKREDKKNN